ncbi:hypothetical protein SSX86_028069 [Deinandra increscens subsp. villosa]|uniref:FCP1 homology domain-containing protein n=1 Tax=Deinandra increscens subsp. villosa TaxID=3103831 RepID=A0AAP0CDD6_9ASTR
MLPFFQSLEHFKKQQVSLVLFSSHAPFRNSEKRFRAKICDRGFSTEIEGGGLKCNIFVAHRKFLQRLNISFGGLEERSMEHDCSVKRRKILHADETRRSESNEYPNLHSPIETRNTSLTFLDESHATSCPTEVSNTEVTANQIDAFSDGKESDNSKNKIVTGGSTMDATEESGSQARNEDSMPPKILGSSGDNGHPHSRKKLLVLDVNGLLVDILANPDEAHKPDTIIGSKAVFKRPYCDEFLKFCFERFSVGIWTSRTRRNIKGVLDFLMRDTQHQLLFCWDQSHCTGTGYNTIENTGKPLVLKELKKLWEKQDRNLPWDRGVYDESNTLLLDDSPYKALRNPPYTAIFPYSYSYSNAHDNGLGPNGDLRNYLERLAASDNVQKFIEQNPFGQQQITHDNESWNFYRKIISPLQPGAGPSCPGKKLIIIEMDGLLVDVTSAHREGFRADTMRGSRAVFKRPYCDEFLQFCFTRFNVGVWTSTTRNNTQHALDFLMRETQHKLLFCWNLSQCTDTGFEPVESNCNRLLVKELRKLWEKKDPNLPWELGEYNESNTLLVENTPQRALLNPPHTSIFPYPYHYWNTEDNSLGPEGDLRIYLEKLAASENVQKFVSENSFGQRPIGEKNLSWRYYQRVIHAFSSKRKAGDNGLVDAQCKNSSKQKPDTAIASVTKTLSEQQTETSTALAAPTLLGTKPNSATSSVPNTLVEPETGTTTALVGQILPEPDLDSTQLAAQALLELETMFTPVSTAPTLSEPEIDSTALAAQTLSVLETFASDDAHSGFTTSSKGDITTDVDNVTVGTPLSAKNKSPSPKRSESNSAVNGSVTCSKGNRKVIASVMGTSGSDDIHQDSLSAEHETIITQNNEAKNGKRHQKRKRGRTAKLVGLEQTNGADDDKSRRKKRGRQPKLVVKKPVGLLEDGHGIATDLDEQPVSVSTKSSEGMRQLSVSKGHSSFLPPDHRDKSQNQANVTTAGITTDYQQEWPFVKQSSLWATVESRESFKTLPQKPKPHFSPLKKYDECMREGLAISHMITFLNIVQRHSCLKLDDPVDVFHKSLESLAELETHGFDVGSIRDHLNEMLSLKSTAGTTTDYQQEWPFVKRSSLWATVESLESFKTLPQKPKPHFSPLKKYDECFREGLAISHMITFLNIVQKLSYIKLNDPVDAFFPYSLKSLDELETHGFDVGSIRDRLNEMLSLKPKANVTVDYQQEWPFVKQSILWATVESYDEFKTLPQKPHFSPLRRFNECFREGLALSHMIRFVSIVQELSYLKLNDPVVHSSLKSLAELETHGFDVGSIRDRLNEMLSLKSKAAQHKDKLREVEEVIEKCNHQKSMVDQKMDQLKVKMQELQAKMALGATMQKRKEEQSMRLQSKLHLVSDKISDQERAFEKLRATPL